MKKANITIISVVTNDEGEEKTEFFTEGSFDKSDEGFVMSYNETDEMGYESCTITITASKNKVLIERQGNAASMLIIEKDTKHHCLYGTPYGEFTMGINTFKIKNELSEEGGTLFMKYCIDIDNDFISENEMLITVKVTE